MDILTNRKSIEQKVCSKRTIQGGIEKFVIKRSSESCLKSGFKQQRIENFFKQKSTSSCSTSKSCLGKTKAIIEDDCIIASKKKKSNLSSFNGHLQCIEIEDGSSSDEYFTAPNTQELVSLQTNADTACNSSEVPFISCSPPLSRKKHLKIREKKDLSSNTIICNDSGIASPIKEIKEEKSLPSVKTNTDVINEKVKNNGIQIHNTSLERKYNLSESDENLLLNQMKMMISENNIEKFRFKVLSVNSKINQTELTCVNFLNGCEQQKLTIKLSENWIEAPVEANDYINLILDNQVSLCSDEQPIQIDFNNNLVVFHPDVLISGTTVSNGLGCIRRAVLSERFKNTEFVNTENVSRVMLVGTIVHSLFQKAIKQEESILQLEKLAEKLVYDSSYLSDIIAINSSQEKILKEVLEYVSQIRNWIKEFCHLNPSPQSKTIQMKYIEKESGNINTKRYSANIALTKVMDIEENVWSPKYGLKGKIDVTGKFKIKNKQKKEEIETIMPIEIKTGKNSNSMEHHVQVAIYSMFCNERRNTSTCENNSIAAGLLLYLKSNIMSCEAVNRADLCGIVSLRNQIAHYLVKTIVSETNSESKQSAPFPPTISNTRLCEMCQQQRNCSLVYKSVDSRHSSFPSLHPSLKPLINYHTSHLAGDDYSYFQHWMTCTFLEVEEASIKDKQMRFWLKSPYQRSLEGQCITGLKLANPPVLLKDNSEYLQTFKRCDDHEMNRGTFEKGEVILISGTEPEFIAIAFGVVKSSDKSFITISTERDFTCYPANMLYSIDRHVWLSQISVQSSLSNLSMIMNNDAHCNRLRKLIINHREPSFQKNLDFVPRSSKDQVAAMLRGLNRTQRQAIKRVLLSNDYTLVVGMPGSGKTTTIVAMIRILLLCNLRILVTSYTHSAVDNLLLKLIRYKVKFLRLGRPSQVHSDLQSFTEQQLSRDFTSPDQLLALYNNARVVGCTCMAVTSHVFFALPGQSRPIFDVCIVDEASQINQPACLSPLLHANKFVLVGDHKQLPPLVISQKAKDMGADESLFRRLTCHKSALCELTLQYRMNSSIMALSNHVTYEGRLECAHPSVAEAILKLDRWEEVQNEMESSVHWPSKILNPHSRVVFLNVIMDRIIILDENENKIEASIVTKIAKCLVQSGCLPSNIGIIAPFRKQVQLLEKQITEAGLSDVEVNTVDKYQGRDKAAIILSFVKTKKSDNGYKRDELLSDWRRLNVAITRAKHKLIMVGCVNALLQYEPCKKLLDYLRQNECIIPFQLNSFEQ